MQNTPSRSKVLHNDPVRERERGQILNEYRLAATATFIVTVKDNQSKAQVINSIKEMGGTIGHVYEIIPAFSAGKTMEKREGVAWPGLDCGKK